MPLADKYQTMKNILIAGDSWGCGEWDYLNDTRTDDYGVSHKGLEQYLLDLGHRVVNVSIAGGSNRQSVELLQEVLSIDTYDYVFWFQTDPIRNYFRFTEESKIEAASNWRTVADILKMQDEALDESYEQLGRTSTTIYCIGGYSKIDAIKLSSYDNLICLIESIPELCCPHIPHPIINFSDWLDYIPKTFEDFDELIKIKYECDAFFDNPDLVEYFVPDGRHANRLGHLKVFEHINSQLGLDKKI